MKCDLTITRVRNFLRREKKEKQREEDKAAKARCSYDFFIWDLFAWAMCLTAKSPNKFWQWSLEPIPGNEVSIM